MHIADGILTMPVMAVTTTFAVSGVAFGLYKMDIDDIPRVGVMSAAFFVASLIHVNIGLSSTHLMLTGVIGMMLGWSAFPALAMALFLQSVFFGFGGLTALGTNIINNAVPAVLCFYFFRLIIRGRNWKSLFPAGFFIGVAGVVLSCFFLAVTLYLCNEYFLKTIVAIMIAHLPIVLIEGFVAGAVVSFLHKVRPDLLGPVCQECSPISQPSN
ncbi:MAG: cobalt transporter CbiM [Desulfobulbaceae bacterium]|nr:cobalt transporter CbiM [Desulfobulbaceae bacterium]